MTSTCRLLSCTSAAVQGLGSGPADLKIEELVHNFHPGLSPHRALAAIAMQALNDDIGKKTPPVARAASCYLPLSDGLAAMAVTVVAAVITIVITAARTDVHYGRRLAVVITRGRSVIHRRRFNIHRCRLVIAAAVVVVGWGRADVW